MELERGAFCLDLYAGQNMMYESIDAVRRMRRTGECQEQLWTPTDGDLMRVENAISAGNKSSDIVGIQTGFVFSTSTSPGPLLFPDTSIRGETKSFHLHCWIQRESCQFHGQYDISCKLFVRSMMIHER